MTSSPIAGTALAEYTTLRVGGPAARFVVADSAAAAVDAVRAADRAGDRLLVLGGGSNLVVADDGFDGTVVHLASDGSRLDGDVLTLEAGMDWDAAVAEAVGAGLGGLECLSGIPGMVGATPVQNVGAYGVEVSDLLVSVDLLDRSSGEMRTVPAADLGLGYRTSVLKGRADAVVLRVRLRVRTEGSSAPIRYDQLARALDVAAGSRVPAADARAAVLELRRGKGMVLDAADHDTWSAGSFFTNPVLPAARLNVVLERTGDGVPRYPAEGGGTKLSAAWLIEHAGFHRGHAGPSGRVALSGKHTLALTNRGGATTADVLDLAREVRDGVRSVFGVTLDPEPVLLGCSLDS